MMSKFFIEHPVLANVLAIVLVLIGAICVFKLPIAQYPNIVPPTVQVITRYPGASAQTVIDIDTGHTPSVEAPDALASIITDIVDQY